MTRLMSPTHSQFLLHMSSHSAKTVGCSSGNHLVCLHWNSEWCLLVWRINDFLFVNGIIILKLYFYCGFKPFPDSCSSEIFEIVYKWKTMQEKDKQGHVKLHCPIRWSPATCSNLNYFSFPLKYVFSITLATCGEWLLYWIAGIKNTSVITGSSFGQHWRQEWKRSRTYYHNEHRACHTALLKTLTKQMHEHVLVSSGVNLEELYICCCCVSKAQRRRGGLANGDGQGFYAR